MDINFEKAAQILGVKWEKDFWVDDDGTKLETEGFRMVIAKPNYPVIFLRTEGDNLTLEIGEYPSYTNRIFFHQLTGIYFLEKEQKVIFENIKDQTVELLEIYNSGRFDLALSLELKEYNPIWKSQDYNSEEETAEIMADPDLVKDIKEAEEDIANGRFTTFEELEEELGWKSSDSKD